MAWIETVHESDADDGAHPELARLYREAVARAGRVFGIVRVMSPQPRVLEASMAFYREVMFGPGPLSRRRRELLAVVVSTANRCHY